MKTMMMIIMMMMIIIIMTTIWRTRRMKGTFTICNSNNILVMILRLGIPSLSSYISSQFKCRASERRPVCAHRAEQVTQWWDICRISLKKLVVKNIKTKDMMKMRMMIIWRFQEVWDSSVADADIDDDDDAVYSIV